MWQGHAAVAQHSGRGARMRARGSAVGYTKGLIVVHSCKHWGGKWPMRAHTHASAHTHTHQAGGHHCVSIKTHTG